MIWVEYMNGDVKNVDLMIEGNMAYLKSLEDINFTYP